MVATYAYVDPVISIAVALTLSARRRPVSDAG
jgi:hypothetical protein